MKNFTDFKEHVLQCSIDNSKPRHEELLKLLTMAGYNDVHDTDAKMSILTAAAMKVMLSETLLVLEEYHTWLTKDYLPEKK